MSTTEIKNNDKSPKWHKDELLKREEVLEAGEIKISNWEDAKERIKRNVCDIKTIVLNLSTVKI